MKIVVDFDELRYLIEFKPFLGKDVKKYTEEFSKWYYELAVEIVDGEECKYLRQRSDLPYEQFDIIPIIDWMKEVAPDSNPKVLGTYMACERIEENYEGTMYF